MTNRKRRVREVMFGLGAALLVAGGIGIYFYHYQRPAVAENILPEQTVSPFAGKIEPADIPWPSYGQAAIGVVGHGVLATHGDQTPVPTASVAKVMTALTVLKKKPLVLGQEGPVLTFTQEDEDLYEYYRVRNGSLAAVRAGEKITEYEALEALLLPSSNNMADTLANWAFGSVEAYSEHANKLAKSIGMAQSDFSDASGYSPATVSTAEDLVKLGQMALQNPVIAEIVAKKSANIPVAGTVYNTNRLLGTNGINGVKTGYTEHAGGVFMGTRTVTLPHGETVRIVSVIMGAPDADTALTDSMPVLEVVAQRLARK